MFIFHRSPAGNKVQYLYDNARDKMYGLPSVVVDGNGNRKETYYDEQGRVKEEYTSDCVEVWYYYNNGNLTEIEKENISATQFYEMLYDAYGNMTGFNIGDRNIATYSYGDRNGYLTKLTYGNQKSVQYTYDLLGRVIQETFSDGRIVDYVYNCNGQLYSSTDSVSGTVYYTYDSLGRLIYAEDEGRGIRFQYQYNTNNQMTGLDICVDGWNSVSEEFYYNGKIPAEKIDGISDGTLTSMQMVTGDMIERSMDALQRLEHRIIADDYQENYFYSPGSGANRTTVQISEKQDVLDGTIINDLQYTYDGNGNITRIYDVVSGESIEYFYDELNQLTSASYSDGKVENYTYDVVGNLLTFNNGIASHTYTYGDSDWIDLLTAVDGVSLTYDEIGNPLSYYNGSSYTMTWTEGRKLASVTTEEGTTSYLYNAEGLRFKKINPDGSYILYLATDGVIIGEKHYTSSHVLAKNMRYTFDENGTVCGYSTSTDGNTWTDYYFIRNLQGDVLQVYRESDNVVVAEYSYDSWGNILSAEKELAEENPFRYRGYYYDAETEFYYLQSRYYDSEIGRFINADNYSSTGQGVLGYNMFAYCNNNPINMMDATGDLSKWATLAIGLAVSVAVVALTVVSLGAAAPAAACTLAMVGTSIGLSYTTAVGVATAATYTVVATASLYAGDIAYSSITGTSPVKEIMFNGNQEAYEDGLLLVSMATAGMIDMATYSPGICFVAGTEVLASSGTVVIENVKAGDYVWASNPETGEVSLKQVVQTFVNETNELVHVQVKDEEIICTNEHPFYLPTKGWVAACELRAGDILVTVNGEYVVVEKVQHEILESPVKVYNFEVEDFHTYYVGETNLLVHNMCKPDRITNCSKSESPIWKGFKNAKNGIKTSGSGKTLKYYTWDNRHNEIEVFDRFGKHLGVIDPTTGEWIKKAVKGRVLIQ